jgi:hypothetical protein
MFLAIGFDKHINANYNMNVVNQRKIKVSEKLGGQGMKIIKKKENNMSGKEYARYIFWIVLTVILMSTLTGS